MRKICCFIRTMLIILSAPHTKIKRWWPLTQSSSTKIIIIKDNKKIWHTLNKYFTNLTKTLKFKKKSPALKKKSLKHLLRQFENHSSKKIKKHNSKEIFTFREFKETEIIKTIKELPKKTNPVHLKTFQWIYCQLGSYLLSGTHKQFQRLCKKWNFPDILKYADITPVFKKRDTRDKTNYRPISTLSNFWKVF